MAEPCQNVFCGIFLHQHPQDVACNSDCIAYVTSPSNLTSRHDHWWACHYCSFERLHLVLTCANCLKPLAKHPKHAVVRVQKRHSNLALAGLNSRTHSSLQHGGEQLRGAASSERLSTAYSVARPDLVSEASAIRWQQHAVGSICRPW